MKQENNKRVQDVYKKQEKEDELYDNYIDEISVKRIIPQETTKDNWEDAYDESEDYDQTCSICYHTHCKNKVIVQMKCCGLRVHEQCLRTWYNQCVSNESDVFPTCSHCRQPFEMDDEY
mgnify:FL=1